MNKVYSVKNSNFNSKNHIIFICDHASSNIDRRYRKKFTDTLKSKPELVKQHNGLYEKDMAKWYSYDDMKKKFTSFRPWYRNIVKQILQNL